MTPPTADKHRAAMERAVVALWRLRPPTPRNLYNASPFTDLRAACQARYPAAGSGQHPGYALGNALHALGMPCFLPKDALDRALPAKTAAEAIDQAFRRTSTRRVHLCPLDLADELPALDFGPARVRRFTPDEFSEVVDAPRLARQFPTQPIDIERFAQFHWLVVEETVSDLPQPDARAVPALFMNLSEDFGRIEPHTSGFPESVEDALFFLLLAPWEEWTETGWYDWRGFRAPWVYTVDDDLFVRPAHPPTPESLSWDLKFFDRPDGEVEEIEVPAATLLAAGAASALGADRNADWVAVTRARQSELFETPVAHFFIRAFMAEGIDEFLAHMTTIEAALGVKSDYSGKRRADAGPRLKPTQSVAARIAALLGGEDGASAYRKLFDLRSEFLHGRPMGPISTDDRILARRLARQVVSALINVAANTARLSRITFLADLRDDGAKWVS